MSTPNRAFGPFPIPPHAIDPALSSDVARYEALMERLVGAYRTRMVQLCKEGELTPPQFWALATIRRLEKTKMSPLAEGLGLSMGAASTLVDRLVTRGLVERTADLTDRRAVHVNLSLKGEAVLTEAIASKQEINRAVLAQLDPPVRAQLLEAFDALAGAWEALPPVGFIHLTCGSMVRSASSGLIDILECGES